VDYRSTGSVGAAGFDSMMRRLVAAPGSHLAAFFLCHIRHVSGLLHSLTGAHASGYVWLGDGREWCVNYYVQYPVFYRSGARAFRKGIR
jgi:hypothetical protein